MNPEYKIQDWIDRYLNDEMNESEKLEFESQLSVDADLVSALKAQKVAHKIVIGEELMKLKAQMSSDLNTGNYPGGIQNRTWRYLFIGSGVVLIAVILYFITKDRNEIAKTELVNQQPTVATTTETSLQPVDSTIVQNAQDKERSSENKEKSFPIAQSQKAQKLKLNSKQQNSSCTDSIISFSCQARGTCIHKNEGAIEIDLTTIKSSNAPFLFSVKPEGHFYKEPIITDLKSGIYTLYVKDSKQCLHELDVKVEVPVISCEHNLPKK